MRDCYTCGDMWTLNKRNALYRVTGTDSEGKIIEHYLCSECLLGDSFISDYFENESVADGLTIKVELVDTALDAIDRRK